MGGGISRDFLVHISGDVRKFNEFRQHFNMVEHGLLLEEWMQIRGRGVDIFRKYKMNKYIWYKDKFMMVLLISIRIF